MSKTIETRISIKDGTSYAQLYKAIKVFEEMVNTKVLKVFVSKYGMSLVEFDGITVGKWTCKDVQAFLIKPSMNLIELVEQF